tara:strand:+ start:1057 stop:1539 length:483 start_codon:yes stop_codon:yes gene_type:complete
MNRFEVSNEIILNHNPDVVWEIISSKNALELFHPYCLKNDVIVYKKKDKLIYLNGLTYIREFSAWKPNNGFELSIGKKRGKKSKIKWKIKTLDIGCEVKISVYPYRSSKIPKYFYPLVNIFIVKPKLRKYLQSVLTGLKFYLDTSIKVKKNQFGKHSWFS